MKKKSNGATVDLKTAARKIGISVFTLRGWARARKIAYLRPGRNFLFNENDIDEFLSASRVVAKPVPD